MLPYDKFQKYGAHSLSDEELLAIILRTGTKGEDALTLAIRVLNLGTKGQGLLGLHHVTLNQLMKIKGIGIVKAVKLLAIAELSMRMATAKRETDICFLNAQSVAFAYMESMRHLEREHFVVIFLDHKSRRIKDETLSVGDGRSTIISTREIMIKAFECHAFSIILLHNHPSGDPTPSRQDIALTEEISEACELVEIRLLDHLIIGDNTYTSLKEKGVL